MFNHIIFFPFDDLQIFFILGTSEARKVRGPTLLKDIWKLPVGKTVDVSFNSRNQAVGKEGRKLASFLGIVARTPELTPLHIDDWRNFGDEEKKRLVNLVRTKDALLKNRLSRIPRDQWTGLVSYWFSDKAKRCSQANRNNRTKQKMPHTGGSKSIATLMDEKDMINERISNGERSTDRPPHSVAWEGDVYSQVLGNEKSGYVRGLGLGPTPSILWGSRSSLGNIVSEDSSKEDVQRLQHEIAELKAKQNEEMNLMKQNQEKMQAEILQMRQFMRAPNEPMPQNINGTSSEQVPDANSGHEGVPQTSRIPSVAENTPPSHNTTHF
ncbi:uncharacterized protein LOC132612036 [Lycium barbarum]|uniref:uncharacterized protein LOC132612036 n=1 Tax=Lycium barbarum TaxID=112863 RepID=UPI00293E9968|nr:uncharacterized protein LOC132612036 [Lycium barbarum]